MAEGHRPESLHEPLPRVETPVGAASGGGRGASRAAALSVRERRIARFARRLPGGAAEPEPRARRPSLQRRHGVEPHRREGRHERRSGPRHAAAHPRGPARLPRRPPRRGGLLMTEALIAKWLEDRGSLTEQEAADLGRLLEADPALAKSVKDQLALDHLLSLRLGVDRRNFEQQVAQRIRNAADGATFERSTLEAVQ